MHFAELWCRDSHTEEFTAVGIGDMSGVFGLLRSKAARYQCAAFYEHLPGPGRTQQCPSTSVGACTTCPRSSWQDATTTDLISMVVACTLT